MKHEIAADQMTEWLEGPHHISIAASSGNKRLWVHLWTRVWTVEERGEKTRIVYEGTDIQRAVDEYNRLDGKT